MTGESKNPLDDFPKYFSLVPAISDADREATFRIRYRVYCEEFGYEPADHFPRQMESDAFDDVAAHCLIIHRASEQPAGCVRICPGTVDGESCPLPLDKACTQSLDPVAMARFQVPRSQVCEASRFAVDGAFRRRSGETLTRFGEIAALDLTDVERRTFPALSVVLMLAGNAMAQLLQRPFMYAVMEPFLPRLLRRSGLIFHRMGKDMDYHGIRAVYISDTREFVDGMDSSLRDLYAWIIGELAPLAVAPVPGDARSSRRVVLKRSTPKLVCGIH